MNPDPFAERLRAQPPSPLPPAWRAEIFAAAAEVIPERRVDFARHRLVWALAATWVVIATLRLLTPGNTPSVVAARSLPPTAEAPLAYQEFAMRTRLLARGTSEEGLP